LTNTDSQLSEVQAEKMVRFESQSGSAGILSSWKRLFADLSMCTDVICGNKVLAQRRQDKVG